MWILEVNSSELHVIMENKINSTNLLQVVYSLSYKGSTSYKTRLRVLYCMCGQRMIKKASGKRLAVKHKCLEKQERFFFFFV